MGIGGDDAAGEAIASKKLPGKSPQWLKDAVIVETAKADSIASHCEALRLRQSLHGEYMERFFSSMQFFYDGMERLARSDYLGITLPEDHRAALATGPEHMIRLLGDTYAGYHHDMNDSPL